METTVFDNQKKQSRESVQTVTFFIGPELYGIDIRNVLEIIKHYDITPVPNCAEYIEGVTNLRGRIVPIINMKKRFFLEDDGQRKEGLIIVVESSDSTAGLIVDSLSKVVDIPGEMIEPKPDIKNGKNSRFIEGLGNLKDKTVIILNCEELLRPETERNYQ